MAARALLVGRGGGEGRGDVFIRHLRGLGQMPGPADHIRGRTAGQRGGYGPVHLPPPRRREALYCGGNQQRVTQPDPAGVNAHQAQCLQAYGGGPRDAQILRRREHGGGVIAVPQREQAERLRHGCLQAIEEVGVGIAGGRRQGQCHRQRFGSAALAGRQPPDQLGQR
jgi:hypothetical protein